MSSLTQPLGHLPIIQHMDRELLDFTLLSQGISIVPTVLGSKGPIKDLPLLDFFEGRRRATLEDLELWLKAGYDRAAITGRCSDSLVVLDFDSHDAFLAFFDKSVQRVAEETFTVKTHRGFSVWVKDPKTEVSLSSLNFRPVLQTELLLSHHLVSCPLNTHPLGSLYEGPLATDVIERKPGFVEAVLERMQSLGYVRKIRATDTQRILKGVSIGERNAAAFKYARYLLFDIELDELAVLNELQRWNLLNTPPLPQKEIETILRSAIKYRKRKRLTPNRGH